MVTNRIITYEGLDKDDISIAIFCPYTDANCKGYKCIKFEVYNHSLKIGKCIAV